MKNSLGWKMGGICRINRNDIGVKCVVSKIYHRREMRELLPISIRDPVKRKRAFLTHAPSFSVKESLFLPKYPRNPLILLSKSASIPACNREWIHFAPDYQLITINLVRIWCELTLASLVCSVSWARWSVC